MCITWCVLARRMSGRRHSWLLGHFEYLVMSFSLTSSPTVFQNLVNVVLSDMLKHVQHVWLVLQHLLENRFFVCHHTLSVGFLGFINECGQVRTDPSKVQVMTDWPVPEIHKLLQYFLGFDNFYRNVIHDFSSVAALLTPLTSTKLSSLCSPDTEESFVWPPVQGWGGRLWHWSRSSVCGSVRWQTTQP